MRSQISDQDLTDYALNELGPEERIYVESMLVVSEECRNDIYEMIDTAMLLEQGFDREEGRGTLGLTLAQRQALLNVRVPNHFFRRTAAVLAAAAAVAFALVSKEQWLPKGPVAGVARVSTHVSNYVTQAVSAAEGEDFVNQLASFRKLTEESAKWLPAQPPGGASVFGSSPSLKLEVAPKAGLDLMP
jgi:anti-sigma factor RsiW